MVGYVQRDRLSGAMARLARLAERLEAEAAALGPPRAAGLRALSQRLGPALGGS